MRSLAIYQQIERPHGIAIACLHLSEIAYLAGEYEQAIHYCETSLRLFREIRVYWGIAAALQNMGRFAYAKEDYGETRRYLLQSLWEETEHRFYMFAEGSLALMARLWLEGEQAERAYELLGLIDEGLKENAKDKRTGVFTILDRLNDDYLPHLAAAVERGRRRDFDAVVKEVIAILSQEVERRSPAPPPMASLPQPFANALTAREQEILSLMADGFSNGEIAARLVLTTGTVKWYVNRLFSKLDATSRTQAVAHAKRRGCCLRNDRCIVQRADGQ